MKSILTILLLLILPALLSAQESNNHFSKFEIEAFYETSLPGHSITCNGTRNFGNHALFIGIKYFDNWRIVDNQHFAYKHRFRETSNSFPLGLNLGYKRNFNLGNDFVKPYFYLQSQLSYLTQLHEIYLTQPSYSYEVQNGPSYFILDNTIGIGLQTRLYKNLYLHQSVGLGVAWLHSEEYINGPFSTWEWSQQFRFGLSYHL